MEENIITWNLPNWITVVLMVTVGFALLAALAGIVQKKRGQAAPSNG
jgi:hypothetical protein